MKIICPSCLTSYIMIKSVKKVYERLLRCSTCGNTWQYKMINDQTLDSTDSSRRKNNYKIFDSSNKASYPSIMNEDNQNSYEDFTESPNRSKPNSELQRRNKSNSSSLSQCVFCRRSSKCNLHDLYSGRPH